MAGNDTRDSKEGGLAWADISLYVGGKRGRWILRRVHGHAKPGRLLAIMGPSGSGKTSLLNALSGKVVKKRGQRLEGRMSPLADVHMAYIPQDELFFSNLTVRETVRLVAQMNGMEGNELEKEIDEVLRKLGLSECADTFVGGNTGGLFVPGISGGERKRLSIACETIGKKDKLRGGVILADEPTTGLDSFQADKVVETLKSLAHDEGAAVVCSLHQPRSTAFHRVDDLMLLSTGGSVCYYGPVSESLPYFEKKLEQHCPEHYNPAEFLIDQVSVDTTSLKAQEESESRVQRAQAVWREHARHTTTHRAVEDVLRADGPVKGKKKRDVKKRGLGPLRQFALLSGRAFRQSKRDVKVNVMRAVSTAGLGIAFGLIHKNLSKGQKGIQARAAVIMQMCINSGMISMVKSLNNFPRERAVVAKEISRRDNGYGVGPYFLSKLCIEGPLDSLFPVLYGAIVAPLCGLNPAGRSQLLGSMALQSLSSSTLGMSVGALATNLESALAIGPCVMVLSIMLGDTGGLLAELPPYLKPLSRLSTIRWSLEGGLLAEFQNQRFACDVDSMPEVRAAPSNAERKARSKAAEAMCLRTGDEVLRRFNLSNASCTGAAKGQAALAMGNILLTYIALKIKGGGLTPQPMESPST